MAAISDLATLAVADVVAGDYLPIYDASAGTDKKTPLFANGSWTPVLAFGGASTGITYVIQLGSYTRIGNMVMAEATIILTSKGSATGAATISGLPFASAATVTAARYWPAALYWKSMVANGYSLMALIASGGVSSLSVYVSTAGANTGAATDANFSDISEIILSAMYEAA